MERGRSADGVGDQSLQRPRKSSWIEIEKSLRWDKNAGRCDRKDKLNLKIRENKQQEKGD
jgi:hypothetical protein